MTSLIGPNAPITIPRCAQPTKEHLPDYEVELAIVIGKAAKDVKEEEALDYVLGYTGANDVCYPISRQVSGRTNVPTNGPPCRSRSASISLQSHSGASRKALVSILPCSRSFVHSYIPRLLALHPDNTNPFGPCIVSTSLIPDPQSIPLKSTVNGTTLQDGNTSDQIFSVRQTVAWLSQGTTLEPGTIILTGTPAGVGFTRSPPVWLKHGDEVRVTLGNGIGTLVNPVVEEGEQFAKL